MLRTRLLVVAALLSACEPTMNWLPQRAKYQRLEPTTDWAVTVYPGDAADFLRCTSIWMGDMVCDPRCSHGTKYGVEATAANIGATHIRKVDAGSERVGTDVSSTDVNVGLGVSTGSTEVRAKYVTWERYRLYWVSAGQQRKCLEPELRAKPR